MSDESGDQSAAIFRAIGRLEGHFSALETRVTNIDTTTDRRLNAVAAKLDSISDAIDGVSKGAIADRSKVIGGWHTMVVVAAVAVSMLSMFMTAYVAFVKP